MDKREYRDRFNLLITEKFKKDHEVEVLTGVVKLMDEVAELAYIRGDGEAEKFIETIRSFVYVDKHLNPLFKDEVLIAIYERFLEEINDMKNPSIRHK